MTSGQSDHDPNSGGLRLITAAMLAPSLALFFVGGPRPSVIGSIGAYVAFVSLSVIVTWILDRRYPA